MSDDQTLTWSAAAQSFVPVARAHPQYSSVFRPDVGQTVFPLIMPCTKFSLLEFQVNGVDYNVPEHVSVSAVSATWQGPFDLSPEDRVFLLWS